MKTIVLTSSDEFTGTFYISVYEVPNDFSRNTEFENKVRAACYIDEVDKLIESIGGRRANVEEWSV